jgi:hypothetical protein
MKHSRRLRASGGPGARVAALLVATLAACRAPETAAPDPARVVGSQARPTGALGSASPAASACPADPADPREEARAAMRRDDATFTHEVPDRDKAFGALVCKAKNGVWRDPTGQVRACTVARPVAIEGVEIAADAYSLFHASGRPYQTHVARARTWKTAAGVEIPCAADFVVLTAQGALESCQLARRVELGNVACQAGQSAYFHEGGQLAGATIDRPLTALDVTFAAGTSLSWHPDGSLAGGTVREPITLSGYDVSYSFEVHPNGQLARAYLAAPRVVAGTSFPERATLHFRPDGTLRRASYEAARGVMIHGEPWTDTRHLAFDCHDGLISSRTEHYQAEHAPHPPRSRL